MKKLATFSIFFGLLAFSFGGLLVPPASAIPGDIDGNGSLEMTFDLMYLIQYLYGGGPAPPNPIDADIDGSPGINMGDLLQLIGYYFSSCSFIPYTGASVRVGSQIRFSSDLISIADGSTLDTTRINIIANGGPDLMGMVIPLSFANQPDEVEVELFDVNFDGTIIPPDWDRSYVIDNVNKTVLVRPYADNTSDTPLLDGTIGLVATLRFSEVADGDPLAMTTTEVPPSHSFSLISAYCANGTSPSERIFSPMLSLALNGDVNCDGIVNIGDVVYTVNYLYKGGPPPCGL